MKMPPIPVTLRIWTSDVGCPTFNSLYERQRAADGDRAASVPSRQDYHSFPRPPDAVSFSPLFSLTLCGQRSWTSMLGKELSYGWRRLQQRPGFTLTALLILGLGIGAN